MKYKFIQEQRLEFPVRVLCEVLEVSEKGVSCSRRRIARLMRKRGLVWCWRRKKRKVVTTDSNHNQPVAPNRLDEI
jgi:hypothetical protein